MHHVIEYTVVLVLAGVVSWLPGYALERLVANDLPTELRGLARWVLGIVYWMLASFALAACGILRVEAVIALALLGGALAVWVRVREGPSLVRRARLGSSGIAGVLALATVAVPFFLLALLPQVTWDADVYHLTLPRLFVENEGFRSVPFSVYSHWPLGVELLFADALLLKDYILAKQFHFGFGLLAVYAIAVAVRAHGAAVSTLAGLLFLANPVVLSELHIAYVDLAVAFFFAAGFLFGFVSLGSHSQTLIALAGVCAGALVGLKVTGVVDAAVLAVLQIPGWVRGLSKGEGAYVLRRRVLPFLLPALLLAVPWPLKAWSETGNPIHPLLYPWLGGVDWSDGLTVLFDRWQASMGMGREPLDYLLLPVRVILQGGPGYAHFDGAIGSFWIVLVPLTLILGRRDRLVVWALWIVGLRFAVWAAFSQQMRFLIPLVALLAMASASTLAGLANAVAARWGARWARGPVWGLVVILALWQPIRFAETLEPGYALLRSDRTRVEALRERAIPAAYRFADAQLPTDAVVLLINDNRTFFCPRECWADSFFQASQIADWLRPASRAEDLERMLLERGVTHLLVAEPRWGIRWPRGLTTLLEDPESSVLLYTTPEGGVRLYELRRSGLLSKSEKTAGCLSWVPG
ncbi:hypothetical protein MK489_12830 [Myxococcota bacterium]|nr:hypothetical protein [Myxococcota bacterium]